MVISFQERRARLRRTVELSIGQRIELARQNRGMTQAQLGQAVGYPQSAISRMEHDRVSVSATDIAMIAAALGCADLAEEYCRQCPVCAILRRLHNPKPAA